MQSAAFDPSARGVTVLNRASVPADEAISRAVSICNRAGFADWDGDGVPDCDDRCPGLDDRIAPCDMNCDGDINALDIEPFLDLLFGGAVPCSVCAGDVNGDGSIDALDIEPFLNCLFP